MNEYYAKAAYNGYRDHTGGKSLATGQNIPEWVDLALVIQQAWDAAARAVVEAYLQRDEPPAEECPPEE